MTLHDKTIQDFLEALKETELYLLACGFELLSFEQKGYAYYISYKKRDRIIEFLFGPAEYHVEMIVYTSKGKFTLGDLVKMPDIKNWWNNNNKGTSDSNSYIKREFIFYIKLFEFSLPFIE